MRTKFLILTLFISLVTVCAEAPFRIVSYNVENLFHPDRDSLNPDTLFTPNGQHHWSYTRYYRKIDNIARVLTNIGEWEGLDIVGLQEVENALVVKRLSYTLRRNEYAYVHYDSPDKRSIDVALIYKKSRFDTLSTRAIPVPLDDQTTRDILYVCGLKDRTDTLHLFVCHLPSQLGGAAESAWKRQAAKSVLQTTIDSILTLSPSARIIVMGDMNCVPEQDLNGVRNRMTITNNQSPITNASGTHKYQGRWTYLDQFYTSSTLDSLSTVRIYNAEWIQEPDEKYLGLKPKRTYNGFRYQNGFSDHLPIILELR